MGEDDRQACRKNKLIAMFDGLEFPDFEFESPAEIQKEDDSARVAKNKRRTTACIELSTRYEYRRAFSEMRLLDACKTFDFRQGHSYHFITAGDVDSLSYLKAILRSRSLTHVLISTWCMSAEDILQLRQWQEDGRLSTIDLYVGEIFPNTYKVEWSMLRDWDEAGGLNRLCVFRNHSKIYAGVSGDFAFVVETSANVNTNPRTEQGVVTIDRGLYDFYKEYFDGIKSFE